jgi:hypothetical protein
MWCASIEICSQSTRAAKLYPLTRDGGLTHLDRATTCPYRDTQYNINVKPILAFVFS